MNEHFSKTGKMAIGGIVPILVGLTMLCRTLIFFFTGKLGVDVEINKDSHPV